MVYWRVVSQDRAVRGWRDVGRSVNAPPPSSPVEPAQFFYRGCCLRYLLVSTKLHTGALPFEHPKEATLLLRLGQFNLPTYLPTHLQCRAWYRSTTQHDNDNTTTCYLPYRYCYPFAFSALLWNESVLCCVGIVDCWCFFFSVYRGLPCGSCDCADKLYLVYLR